MAAPSEIIKRKRTALLKILQQDPDCVLDILSSQRLISEEEYEALEKVTDSLKKSQKLLILVRKKGEVTCHCLLECLLNTFPESATTEFLQYETRTPQSMRGSLNSEDPLSPDNPEITMFSKWKEHLDLESTEFFRNKKSSCRETALTSRENEEECDTPKVTAPHSFERAEYEIPTTITYLKDGQRYEEPDDSLYLGEEEYEKSDGYSEAGETIVEEGDCDDLEQTVYEGEEEEYSETMGHANEEHSYEDSEADVSLEEEDHRMQGRKEVFKHVLSSLNMDRSRKLLPEYVKQFSLDRGCTWTPETPGDLAWNFLIKVQSLDVTARETTLRHRVVGEDSEEDLLTGMESLEIGDMPSINPLDVLCACLLCSEGSLQREVMTNMYECHFALPLLLPDAENNKSILMLGAMRDIVQKPSAQSLGHPTNAKFLSLTRMPVISFVRLGHCSFSKSRILNTLLSPGQQKSHKIFLYQDSSLLVLPRQISDGLVEITWCFPDSHNLKETSHCFQKPVAVANLRGDLESFWLQFGFLMEVSSAVFFCTDHLGEREWDLLMFLGETAMERCYFVLSPQAKESEEAQIFQRILKLKPSQLLFLEGEEAGDRRENMEDLQVALQEVMSSSLRCVSVEDMASLARELGIQVDQDFELAQGIQVSSTEKMARAAEGETQQRHSQKQSSSKNQAQMSVREPETQHKVSQDAQNFHQTPVSMPLLEHPPLLPTQLVGNFNCVPLNAPWVMGANHGSEPRAKPFQNTGAHSRGKNFGTHYFKPQRPYSGESFMKIPRTSWGYPLNGMLWRTPRPISQHVWTFPKSLQTVRALQSSGAVASHGGHFHSVGSQPARAVRMPEPGKAQVTQLIGIPNIKYPCLQPFQPAGAIQTLVRPASHQGPQLMTQGGLLNPAFQPRSHSVSGSKVLPTSQFNSHQPKSQVKHFQPKPSQTILSQHKPSPSQASHPQSSQSKPSRSKPSHPQSSQSKPSPSKPSHPQSSQSKPSPSQPSHPQSSQSKPSRSKPSHSQSSQSKPSPSQPSHSQSSQSIPSPSQPSHPQSSQSKPSPSKPSQPKPNQSQSKSQTRPIQPKSSQAKLSQAKAHQPRAGPKRAGKH